MARARRAWPLSVGAGANDGPAEKTFYLQEDHVQLLDALQPSLPAVQ